MGQQCHASTALAWGLAVPICVASSRCGCGLGSSSCSWKGEATKWGSGLGGEAYVEVLNEFYSFMAFCPSKQMNPLHQAHLQPTWPQPSGPSTKAASGSMHGDIKLGKQVCWDDSKHAEGV